VAVAVGTMGVVVVDVIVVVVVMVAVVVVDVNVVPGAAAPDNSEAMAPPLLPPPQPLKPLANAMHTMIRAKRFNNFISIYFAIKKSMANMLDATLIRLTK
jgi:hypothetical protein